MKTLFLIVSNARTGSTWLNTLLGQLPQVYTDHEIKANIDYKPNPIHIILEKPIDSILNDISGEPFVGSKFVFDTHHALPLTYKQVKENIVSGVKYVHLIRNYKDCLVSDQRGAFNKLSESSVVDQSKSRVSVEVLSTLSEIDETRFNQFSEEKLSQYLLNRYVNDLVTVFLLKDYQPFYIEYESMTQHIPQLLDWLGYPVEQSTLQQALNNPVTRKLQNNPNNVIPDDIINRANTLSERLKMLYKTPKFTLHDLKHELQYLREGNMFGEQSDCLWQLQSNLHQLA